MAETPEEFEGYLSRLEEIALPQRGDLLQGRVMASGSQGLIIDLGLKRDGLVPRSDLERLPPEQAAPQVGDWAAVMVMETEDADGNLLVSISQARESGDWIRARQLMEQDAVLEGVPCSYNRGGLITFFGCLRAFVPASHLSDMPRGLDEESRLKYLSNLVGRTMPFKVIEVDPQRRRLVLSERKAIRQWRMRRKGRLIEELHEGDIRQGVVTALREFGAFVDIGGADGLVHISELCWRRVEHPGEVLRVGQCVEAKVIALDRKATRIGLSLKRLQPNPWERAAEEIEAGQELDGSVVCCLGTSVVVCLPCGLEGVVAVEDSQEGPQVGDRLRVRVVVLEPGQEKIELEWVHS